MSLPSQRCPWCAAELPRNANAALHGIATVDEESGAYIVSPVNALGMESRSWVAEDVGALAGDAELVDDGDTMLVLEQGAEWATVADEAAVALAGARLQVAVATRAAGIVARCAHDDGMSEVELARRLGVDRMTIRRWLGKL